MAYQNDRKEWGLWGVSVSAHYTTTTAIQTATSASDLRDAALCMEFIPLATRSSDTWVIWLHCYGKSPVIGNWESHRTKWVIFVKLPVIYHRFAILNGSYINLSCLIENFYHHLRGAERLPGPVDSRFPAFSESQQHAWLLADCQSKYQWIGSGKIFRKPWFYHDI